MEFPYPLFSSGSGVLLGTGTAVLASWLLGLLPKLKEYVPTLLTNGNALIYGTADADSCTAALLICAALCILCIGISIPIFAKKKL